MNRDLESNINRTTAAGSQGRGIRQFPTEGTARPDHRLAIVGGVGALASIITIGGVLYLLSEADGNGNGPVITGGIDEPTNSPMPSQEPSIPINTPQGTFEVTFPPPPTETPTPTESLSPLEQNIQNWMDGGFEIQTRWRLEAGGKEVHFGFDEYLPVASEYDYYYTGVILGSMVGENGHIITFIGMEDGTEEEGNRFFVPVRLHDRIRLKETTSLFDGPEFGEHIGSSRDFHDKVNDGAYLNKMIKFMQPFDPDPFKRDLYPLNFPNLANDVKLNVGAANAFHEFALSAENSSWRTLPQLEFLNAGPEQVTSMDINSFILTYTPSIHVPTD